MKKFAYKITFCATFLFLISFVSAAHYISGIVNDAEDYEASDGKTITLWNPENGLSDNLTDIIGTSGNSGYSKTYLIDCEVLSTPCAENDTLYLKVFTEENSNYGTEIIGIEVTSNNTDFAPTTKLNSLPQVEITSPENNTYLNSQEILINCSYEDQDLDSATIILYTNFSGIMEEYSSQQSSPNNITFSTTPNEGFYEYYCSANDSISTVKSKSQFLTVDRTNPSLNSIFLNSSASCGAASLNITCEASDDISLKEVVVEAISETTSTNYTAIEFSNGIYSKILTLSEIGTWSFYCYAIDSASNIQKSSTSNFEVYSNQPDLRISSSDIVFSENFPTEGQNITINATINNYGCSEASSVLVEFFEEDPSISGTLIDSRILSSIENLSSKVATINYIAKIGGTNIFIAINEDYENTSSKSLLVKMWQYLYGTIDAIKVLENSDSSEVSEWGIEVDFGGSIFIADKESQINWLSLMAIGRKTDNSKSIQDLDAIDGFLGSQNYDDSVSNTYSSASEENFTIHNYDINYVMTTQSTDNNNFTTGILWDTSDDTDGQYAGNDKEDIVFVSKINKDTKGKYGTYDYELKTPAKLREYDNTDSQYVYFYYDLA